MAKVQYSQTANGVVMNTIMLPTYMHNVNEFIDELKSIKNEIDSHFNPPQFHIIASRNATLEELSNKINIHYKNNASIKINLKEIDCFLKLTIRFAENYNAYFSCKNNNSPEYSKSWKGVRKRIKKIDNISKSIQLLNKRHKEKAEIIVRSGNSTYPLPSKILKKLERNLIIFNKRAAAVLDLYKPPFSNKKIHLPKTNDQAVFMSPAPKGAEKIRALLIENREAIIRYFQKPSVLPKIHSEQEARHKRSRNYAWTPEHLCKAPKNSTTLEKIPN